MWLGQKTGLKGNWSQVTGTSNNKIQRTKEYGESHRSIFAGVWGERVIRGVSEAKIKNEQNNLSSCFKWRRCLPSHALKNVSKTGLPGDAGHWRPVRGQDLSQSRLFHRADSQGKGETKAFPADRLWIPGMSGRATTTGFTSQTHEMKHTQHSASS